MKNYYELLQVNENASQEVIEKAYRVLAKKYHPDVQPSDKIFWAESEFKKINEAYTVLSDPEKRIIYDFDNGLAKKNSNKEDYDNLYLKHQKLEKEVDLLKKEQSQNESVTNSWNPIAPSSLKSYINKISQLIYNESKKSKADRSKDFKAFILTAIIMVILIFLFWKIPFIRNFLFPW